jgi:hypothetical protein
VYLCLLACLDTQEALLLESAEDLALLGLLQQGSHQHQCGLRLRLNCVSVDHVKTISLAQLLTNINAVRVFGELLDHLDVVLIPGLLGNGGYLPKQLQLLRLLILIEGQFRDKGVYFLD